MKYLSKILIIASIFLGSFLTPFQLRTSTPEPTTPTSEISKGFFATIEIIPLVAYAETSNEGPDYGESSSYFKCSWWNLPCHILDLTYFIAVPIGNFLVGLAGMVLDFFMLHSISSNSYRSGFIEAGWEILRDITNIFFVFGLLYLAFQMVLGQGNAKKSLINIILVALTINFSLFMTYLVIDVSNIFAHVFYNKIVASEVDLRADTGDFHANINIESRSLAIADKIDPQKLTDIVENNPSSTLKFIIVLIAGFINYTLILTFLSVSLLMLGRTISLFMSGVLAPLAFASIIIPKMKDIEYIGFGKWLQNLLGAAFMAPVFLFFLYITVQFINIGLPGSEAGENVFNQILNIVIPMVAIVVLIKMSKSIATKMAGSVATIVAKTASKIVSTVGKVSMGAAAIGLTAGAAATSTAMRGIGYMTGGEDSKVGRSFSKIGKVLGSTKIDITKIPGFNKVAGGNVTKYTQKITGKSSRGRNEAFRKWGRSGPDFIKNTSTEDEDAKLDRIKDKEKKKKDKEKNQGSSLGAKVAAAERAAAENERKFREETDSVIEDKQKEKTSIFEERSEAEKQMAVDKAAVDASGPEVTRQRGEILVKIKKEQATKTALESAGKGAGDPEFDDVVSSIDNLTKQLHAKTEPEKTYDESRKVVDNLTSKISGLNKAIKERKEEIKVEVKDGRKDDALTSRRGAAGTTAGVAIGSIIMPGVGSALGGAIGKVAGTYFNKKNIKKVKEKASKVIKKVKEKVGL